MRKNIWVLFTTVLLVGLLGCAPEATTSQNGPDVSGEIVGGYRILPIAPQTDPVRLTVYRGDYIKFKPEASISGLLLAIPALSIEQEISRDIARSPYFKMKETGTYPFSLGTISGEIQVIDYLQANYREVTAKEAAELIDNVHPLILDVRTAGEYRQGHLRQSLLIPVQELQQRHPEISAYKNQDVLIYCATGNRSTVASKILIDAGFKRIYNLRHGISDWSSNHLPVVR